MGEHKISVIVPIYNVEKNLPLCLESLEHQNYSNLEIILVDDGSPDKCGELAEEYAKRDSRAIVIHKENGGLSDARNAGLKVATGDYISFLDSDDFIHPDMYVRLAQVLEEKQCDVSICNFQYVGESQAEELYAQKKNSSVEQGKVVIYTGLEVQHIYYDRKDLRLPFTVAWGKLYRKELWIGKEFPKGKLHEDEFTTYLRMFEAKKVAFADEALYYYLVRDTSIMGSTFKKNRLDILEAFLERMQFYRENKLDELWTKAVFHGTHMSVQLQEWSKGQYKDEFAGFRKKIKAETKGVKKDWSIKQKIDLVMYLYFHPLYMIVWRKRKGK